MDRHPTIHIYYPQEYSQRVRGFLCLTKITFFERLNGFIFGKNSQYLLRGEQIALHVAGNLDGAQLYIGCAQINVVNGGKGTPGPLVSFPGKTTSVLSVRTQRLDNKR